MEKVKKLVKSILLFILYLVYNSVIVFFIKKICNCNVSTFTTTNKVIILSVCEISLFLIFFLIYKKTLKEEFKDFRANASNYLFKGVIIWAISVVLMIISNIIISTRVGSTASNEELVQSIIKIYPVYMLLSSVIYAPFIEELIFRKSIRDFINNNIIYVLISGISFGYIHTLAGTDSKELLFIIPYAIVGSAFAYIYTKTKNIFVSMTLHAIHNAIVVIISILSFVYAVKS